jgi:hypothetical protein
VPDSFESGLFVWALFGNGGLANGTNCLGTSLASSAWLAIGATGVTLRFGSGITGKV